MCDALSSDSAAAACQPACLRAASAAAAAAALLPQNAALLLLRPLPKPPPHARRSFVFGNTIPFRHLYLERRSRKKDTTSELASEACDERRRSGAATLAFSALFCLILL